MEKNLLDIAPNFSSYLDSKNVKTYFARRRDSSLYGKKIVLDGDETNSGVKVRGKDDYILMQRRPDGRFLKKLGELTVHEDSVTRDISYFGIVPGYSNHSGSDVVILQYFGNDRCEPHRTDGHGFMQFP